MGKGTTRVPLKARLVLAGTVCLAASLVVGGVDFAAAGDSGTTATAAKKKRCKAGFKRRGRRCIKKVVPLPLAVSKVRGTLTWNNPSVDLDLHFWAPSGVHTGYSAARPGPGQTPPFESLVPNVVHGGDATFPAGGSAVTATTEFATDLLFIDSPLGKATNQKLTWGVCLPTTFYEDGSVFPASATTATLTYVRTDATVGTTTFTLAANGQGHTAPRETGAFAPSGNWCL